jgi:WXG100 family type VII secretion target
MPAPVIRGDFDQLESLAKDFARNAQEWNSTVNKVQRSVTELENGGWVGVGANKFYREMSNEVMPAMKRLTAAMQSASRSTVLVLKLLKEVESVWMQIFRMLGVGGALGTAGGAGVAGGGAGAAGDGAGGGAGAVAGVSSAAWQEANPLLVRDPNELFSDDSMGNLVGSQFQGTGGELGRVMNELLDNPSEARTDELLIELAGLRGRGVAEIRVEWDKFQEVQEQQAENNPEGPDELIGGGAGGAGNSHMGSLTQMRYGSVVGEAFGIDPAFGAMLNPTGGLVGWGPLGVPGGETAVGYHGIVHDAAGYMYTNHNAGPGYDYVGTGGRGLPGSPLSGQANGIAYWRGKVGSDRVSSAAEFVMREGVGGIDRASSFFDNVGSFF